MTLVTVPALNACVRTYYRGVVANGGTIHGPYRTFARFRVGACAPRRDITDAASVCHRACG